MKKQNLLTRTLLLFALIAGSTGVWGQDVVLSEDFESGDPTGWTADAKGGGTTSGASALYTGTDAHGEGTGKAQGSAWKLGTNSNPYGSVTTAALTELSGDATLTFWARGKSSKSPVIEISGTNCTITGDGGTTTTSGSVATGTIDGSNYKQFTVYISGGSAATTIQFKHNGPSGAGSYIYIDDIVITSTATVTKHTLSSAVSPVGVGTVTLGATEVGEGKITNIKAEANDGYRFVKWTVTGTGAFVATDTDAETTFTMGTTDATVTANFEEIPSHFLSYVVTPTGAGTVTLSSSSVKEDATATAEAAANAGYKFTGWSISGTGATLSSTTDNPTTVTMGTADATVTANFTAVTTYAISWNVNGTVVKTDNVEENTSITFPTSIEGIPAGYVLKGWSTAEVITPQENEPATKVTSATSTAATTYYAILAVEIGTPVTFARYEKVTAAQDDWSGTYILASTYDGGSDESKKGTWMYTAPASSKKYGEIAAIGDLTTEASDYELVIAKSTNGYTIYHTNSKLYFAYNGSNNQLDFAESVTDKKQEWTITGVAVITNAQSTSRVLKYNGSSPRFACYTSGQTATDLYKRVENGGTSYVNYCTTVPAISVTVTDAKYATFSDNTARDFSESGITVYTAKADGTKVELEEVTDGIVPANTGVVLYAANAITKSIPAVATDKTSLADNEMVANVAAATVKYDGEGDKKNFILAKEDAGVGFYAATADGATLAANRAYLSTTSVPASGVRFLGFDDDETTSIRSVENGQLTNENVFNLAGQRVAHPVKGLYIVNGKKVVVK